MSSQPAALGRGVDRWPLGAFGDEIAPDLAAQLAVLGAHSVTHLEFRSAWGVNVVELDSARLERAARLLRDFGIGVCAVASPVGKAPIEGDFEVELRRFAAALEAAERLGSRLVRIFSFFITQGLYERNRDEVLRRLSVLARQAERRQLTLVHENESYIYGDTAERCADLVESVGSPALKLAFDPANFVQAGLRPVTDAWPLLKLHVAHVHVKDAVAVDRSGLGPYPCVVPQDRLLESVRLPGAGQGQLLELLGELDKGGYDGFLTIEPHLQHQLRDLDGAGRFAAALAALRGLTDAACGPATRPPAR